MHFGIQHVCLDPGDLLLGYTDGLTEARSPRDELFTRGRLDVLFESPSLTAESLLEQIQSNLLTFMGIAPLNDDVTMLAVQRKHI